jgi:dTDP-4-amino-4,6-dideoxygalactose transaminase/acetyltransferase-like isoleucine patch superfamily enzyme
MGAVADRTTVVVSTSTEREPAFFVHETAVVEDGASIGRGTRVWHHCHVQAGAIVGARCSLGKDCFVASGARVGDGVRVQNGVSIYEGVSLDDDVFVGPHAVFTNVDAPRAFVSRRSELAPTHVGRGASIGAGATIVCGHRIGPYAFVGAGAVVTADVPAHALVVGNPARRIGWVSRLGRRLGPDLVCPESGERYVERSEGLVPDQGDASADGPTTDEPVPFQDLALEHAALAPALRSAFDRVLSSGRFVLGAEVEALERALAERMGVAHAVGVSSGTDALVVALLALGIGPGDEVVTSPLSFFATAGAIVRVGARPVFADVEPDSLCLDAERVRAAVTERTRAIVPVHLFGRPASPEVFALARSLGVPVVEDAAQALGARSPEGAVGALGALGCFSFFPTKNLGALGDGGLVTTDDPALAERARLLRAQGARAKYEHVVCGGNFRLDALQAAFLSVKLPHLDEQTARRRAHAEAYERAFATLAQRGLRTPGLVEGHVYHQYVLRHPERDQLRAHLTARRVGTEVYYPTPLHLVPALASLGHRVGDFPVAEKATREALALPVFPALGEGRRRQVIDAVLDAFERQGE